VDRMPLADVLAIAWSSPLFALVFAGLLLKEPVGRRRWLAATAGFAGVAVMMQPSGDVVAAAALFALAAAMFTGAEVATMRALARDEPTLTVLVINNALGTVIACTAAALVAVTPSPAQLLLLALIGPVMLLGQALFLRALAIVTTSEVAPFYYTTIVWAAVIGLLVFDEAPGWHLLVGGTLIAAGGVYTALAPRRSAPA
jgi:drug/metabolite transporter (DMT)-like permease